MPKYGVISGPYFPVFSPNTGKYRPEITPYVDTFHAVKVSGDSPEILHKLCVSTKFPQQEII